MIHKHTTKPFLKWVIIILILFSVSLFYSPSSRCDSEQIVIIVNSRAPIQTATVAEIKRLFLKERQNWSNGEKAFPIHAKQGSKARILFQNRVLNMTPDEEATYWQTQKVVNGTSSPPEFSNVQRAVFSLAGSIGYCLKSTHKPGTSKIILTL